MSSSIQEIRSKVPSDTPGIAKGSTAFDGLLQGYAVQIAGNSRDARESCDLGRHVADLEAWTIAKARSGQADAAIRFQKAVLKKLAPAGTDAINVAGLAVGIETSIVSFFDEIEPGVFRFRLADLLSSMEQTAWSRG
jgi:hypothetical protein